MPDVSQPRQLPDVNVDSHVDDEIRACLDLEAPKSFFQTTSSLITNTAKSGMNLIRLYRTASATESKRTCLSTDLRSFPPQS